MVLSEWNVFFFLVLVVVAFLLAYVPVAVVSTSPRRCGVEAAASREGEAGGE